MTKSYSKIRHIQESNQRLENRILNEQTSMEDINAFSTYKPPKELRFDNIQTDGPKLKVYPHSRGDIDPHTVNTILAIGTAFIPFVGPFISAGIGLYDAKVYYDEGDSKTAGLVGLFSIIPGIGGLATKLGLTKWSSKALGNLAKKVSFSTKLTPGELKVVNRIATNKALIQKEINKLALSKKLIKNGNITKLAKKNVKKQLIKKNVATTLGKTASTVGGYVAAGGAYSKTYDAIQKNTPRAKAESEGLNWEFVKSAFGSSGTEQDNTLLNQAWTKGWRPGQVVPKGFQTALYQKNYNEEQENIKKLEAMIASVQ